MNKKSCIAFVLFVAVLLSLTACARHSRYGKIIVDERGMEHVIMTDASGVTVVDKFGNLVEVVTDSKNKKPIAAPTENGTVSPLQEGEYQTNAVTFPALVENDNVVEDMYCTVTLPDGWESIGRGHIILQHKESGAQISFFTGLEVSLDDKLEQMETDRATLDADFEYSEAETTIGGYKAYCGSYDIGDICRSAYLLKTDRELVMEITCTVKADQKNNVDFDAVLASVRFK